MIMNMREHKGFAHGLRDGETRDLNCPSCKREDQAGKFRAEVLAYGERRWASNGLVFDTAAEALDYARDLRGRWTSAKLIRVVPTEHPQREVYFPGSEM